MKKKKSFWKKLKTISKWKLLSALGVLIVLVLIFRGCKGPIIAHKKVYVILHSTTWAPLELFGKDPNMGAFVDELLTEIAHQEKFKIYISTVSDADSRYLFQLLNTKQYDGILVTFIPNPYFLDQYLISDIIYNAGPVLMVPESSTAKSITDLKGKPIGIKTGSSLIFQLSQENNLLISYDNIYKALDDLENNIISGVILDAELAQIYTNGFYKGKIKIATAPLTNLGLRLVTLKSPEEQNLIELFNKGLEESEKNGTFQAMIAKWGLTNP